MKQELTAERARELLSYEPKSGILRWRVQRPGMKAGAVAGTLHCRGYLQVSVYGSLYLQHRIAWLMAYGRWPVKDIDHRNGVRTDNRISNLRECTPAQNTQNMHRSHCKDKTRPMGITRDRGQWRASIKLNRKNIFLGRFATPEEASAAYLSAKIAIHPFSELGGTL